MSPFCFLNGRSAAERGNTAHSRRFANSQPQFTTRATGSLVAVGRRSARFLVAAMAVAVLAPHRVLACAACYGASDAPMARGMNWGILSLLGVIGMVLVGVASFFVYLAMRSAKAPAPVLPTPHLAESSATL